MALFDRDAVAWRIQALNTAGTLREGAPVVRVAMEDPSRQKRAHCPAHRPAVAAVAVQKWEDALC
ncbi:hypothetical protein [Thioalkalivibrio paradoxus]|uniref:hypothetical protein n=1 Tax=Thioalkalivibrio paradoxus TaxID=108010 RepID=UPI00022C0F30|nr:hypothetical protein [Thioalkalivibrio paradoxus]